MQNSLVNPPINRAFLRLTFSCEFSAKTLHQQAEKSILRRANCCDRPRNLWQFPFTKWRDSLNVSA